MRGAVFGASPLLPLKAAKDVSVAARRAGVASPPIRKRMKQIGFWAMASKSKASGLNFKVQTKCEDAEPACGLQFAGIIPQHGLTRMSFEASGVFAANFRQCFTY